MNTKSKTNGSKENSSSDTTATVDIQIAPAGGQNPYFQDANRAASELFYLLRDGLPATATSADDRLRLEAVHAHAENEIQSLADGLSAIGSLISLSGQVADDAGVPGITLIRIGILIDHMAVTLDAVNELRSDAACILSRNSAGGAA